MTSPGAEGPKRRSPAPLDAAVEEMCRSEHPLWGQYRPEARAEVAQKMSRALEAALPHLQSSPEGVAPEPRPSRAKGSEPAMDVPSGGAQEPSEEALIAAVVALAEAQGLAEGVVSSTQAHAALRAAYAVDRPREPSPELREKVEKLKEALRELLPWADTYEDNMLPGDFARRDQAIANARARLDENGEGG